MKVIKPAKLPVLTRAIEIGRRPFFHVGVAIAFPFPNPRALFDELRFWKLATAELGASPFDEGLAKATGEVLVAGRFFAPGGVPAPTGSVRVRIGSVDKRLAVFGPRTWKSSGASEPAPITTMPVDWAHALRHRTRTRTARASSPSTASTRCPRSSAPTRS
jgi:hypothetical protein